jgi:SAM-dependent methyltransferase
MGANQMGANQENSKLLWSDEADERVRYGRGFHWVESPIVLGYINRNITGDARLNWVEYSAAKYMRKVGSPRILSLGCGGGAGERDLVRLIPDAVVTGLDFSPGAIALASARAREEGFAIEYRIADLNEVTLEPGSFDFVFASSALHHVAKLEHILEQVRRCLKPHGKLIANDYVGPNQLQWTSAQVEAINEILALLPDRYRRRVSDPAQYKREFLGPGKIEDMNRLDPTEAVRAQDIVPLTRKMFHLLEFKPFGGTLLHMLLQDILGNFHPADETDTCVLKLICHVELKLIATGALPSDFAYFVAELPHGTHEINGPPIGRAWPLPIAGILRRAMYWGRRK